MCSEDKKKDSSIIYHSLACGKVLCRFSDGVPEGWPARHKWSRNIDHVACSKCR